MLVLTRKEGEQIRIGDDIIITVVRSGNDKVRLGIEAPTDTVILRSELKDRQPANPCLGTLALDAVSGFTHPLGTNLSEK